MNSDNLLWYATPAATWHEALPLGNGRIGAMCFGRPGADLLRLNDDRGWSGSPASELASGAVSAETARSALASSRDAVAAEEFHAAEEPLHLLQQRYTQSFLPFSDLRIDTGLSRATAATDYHRQLRLDTAVHEHRYRLDGFWVRQTAFVSAPAGVLVVHMTTEHPDGLWLGANLTTDLLEVERRVQQGAQVLVARLPSDAAPIHELDQPHPLYDSDPSSSITGATVLRVIHDGTHSDDGPATGVRNATLLLATATTFAGLGRPLLATIESSLDAALEQVRKAESIGYERLLADHIEDHRALYDRATVHFESPTDMAPVPTDERLSRAANAPDGALQSDPGLAALLFDYGRYLLVASSRAGTLATNLQGIWNDLMRPPWSSNYTININTQMNYWPVEVANLSELHGPFFDLAESVSEHGAETAARLFGLNGWVSHHNTDIWGFSSPVGMGRGDNAWAFWPMSGPWMVSHFRQHLQFGAGEDFARDRAWPIACGAAEFMLGWLTADDDGFLGTPVSTSPENHFVADDGVPAAVAASSTMDMSLVRELFDFVVDLADLLGLDSDVARRARDARERLRPTAAGADGRILEWPHGRRDSEVHHRHVSHLYGLYPGDEQWGDELRAAASRSLDVRGSDSTGWSLAWKLCLRARLHQPRAVGELLNLFFREPQDGTAEWGGALYPNLMQSSPPFQIDANFGYVAAIAECLVQSHRGVIEILPALPAYLGTGWARGLVARPGVELDLSWSDGRLDSLSVTARRELTVEIDYAGWRTHVELPGGVTIVVDPAAREASPA